MSYPNGLSPDRVAHLNTDAIARPVPKKRVRIKVSTAWVVCYALELNADVAELVDALDLGSSVFGREGSSPFIRINLINGRPGCSS